MSRATGHKGGAPVRWSGVPFNLSFTHLAVIGVVALVVLGPDRLPGVARTAGSFWREWQRIRGGLELEVREAINEFKEPFRESFHGEPETDPSAPPAERGPITVPSLGPSTGLVAPGPALRDEMPLLGPPADPDTFVPFQPPGGAGS